MDNPIISLCRALRHETESVMEYEEIIAEIGNSEAERGVKQIQTLTISLSKMFAGPEPGMNKPEDPGDSGEVKNNG